MLGLIVSQMLPGTLGAGYAAFKKCSDTLLYICLGFIMINVGREFEIDKTRWRSYTADYFIAMATAALPWILIVLYYVFALLPPELWTSGEAWKENLLLSRFAAPTSAGILFTMLAALSLKKSWIYKKIQVLAIFDDLDTILLMIPLQILMTGLRWQMFAIIAVVTLLLAVGWRWQATWNVRQDWKTILGLAVVVCALTQLVHIVTARLYGPDAGAACAGRIVALEYRQTGAALLLPRPQDQRTPRPLHRHVHPRRGGRGRNLHRTGLQSGRPGAHHLGADTGAEPDPHGRLRGVGQETGPAHLRARSAAVTRLNNPIFTIKRRKP